MKNVHCQTPCLVHISSNLNHNVHRTRGLSVHIFHSHQTGYEKLLYKLNGSLQIQDKSTPVYRISRYNSIFIKTNFRPQRFSISGHEVHEWIMNFPQLIMKFCNQYQIDHRGATLYRTFRKIKKNGDCRLRARIRHETIKTRIPGAYQEQKRTKLYIPSNSLISKLLQSMNLLYHGLKSKAKSTSDV